MAPIQKAKPSHATVDEDIDAVLPAGRRGPASPRPRTVPGAPKPKAPSDRRLSAVDGAKRSFEDVAAARAGDSSMRARSQRKVVMVVEIRDTWRRREGSLSSAWVEVMAGAVVHVHDQVTRYGGEMVAALGARVVVTFPLSSAADAFDAAIAVQHASHRSSESGPGWVCAVSLATGEVIDGALRLATGSPLVGAVVDRALLLCSWAHAGAIVADECTVIPATAPEGQDGEDASEQDWAGPGPLTGRLAHPAARRWSLGTGRVLVGQAGEAIEYWELLFDREGESPRPGRGTPPPRDAEESHDLDSDRDRGDAGTADAPAARPGARGSSARAGRPDRGDGGDRARREGPRPPKPVAADRSADNLARVPEAVGTGWSKGVVKLWFDDHGRGVVASANAQEFYVDRRLMACAPDRTYNAKVGALEPGSVLFFVPREPVSRGRNPAAGATLVEGSEVHVRLDSLDRHGFGWAEVRDSFGTRRSLLVELGSRVEELNVGAWVRVRIVDRDGEPLGDLDP